jgi:hypothetical protein
MQRCRCGEWCKHGNDDPRTASAHRWKPPFMRAGPAGGKARTPTATNAR